ncbi:TQXA domain-containing protein [Streptomyces sp. NPDC093094]|uniref:TQXA domain-containing protein n=1 Tax=Streptomyces sp. NPDC093094 TaxID=3366026 RepID=UPI00380D80AC
MTSLSVPVAVTARRRGPARLAATTLASGLVVAAVLAGAGPAAADSGAREQGGAVATMDGLETYGTAVVHAEGGDQEVPAGLFEMSVEGGGTLQTYCVDLYSPAQREARYRETSWSGTSLGGNKDAGRIGWILRNSYPQVNDLAALARRAGISGGLTEQDAAAGTQVAIWRWSDGADVEALDPQAERLADYLQKSARSLPEPRASLTLEPPAVSGHPGELLGPVTVRTNAQGVTLTPPAEAVASGVRIVGKDGKDVTEAGNGTQLFFDVPEDAADGSAELTVQASTTVPVGRAFAADSRSQTQILAGSSESTVSATASAVWARSGAIPALSARENCAEDAVDIAVRNPGDEPFVFELLGIEHSIPAGASQTVTVPLREDQAYDFTITAPSGPAWRFTGVLDCRTKGDTTADERPQLMTGPSPATVGGVPADVNLAETGGSDTTPLIGGAAIALVLIGGTVLLLLRDRHPAPRD